MGDVAAITNQLYRYAELIDAADFPGLAELLAECTLRDGTSGSALASGAGDIAAFFERTVVVHADGTLRTSHIITNPIVEIEGDTAEARSRYTVMQQLRDFPLQTIIVGRYHDRFERHDGAWIWRDRNYFADLYGDLSRHLA